MTSVFNTYASSLCKLWRHDLGNSDDGIICVQSQFSRLVGKNVIGYHNIKINVMSKAKLYFNILF